MTERSRGGGYAISDIRPTPPIAGELVLELTLKNEKKRVFVNARYIASIRDIVESTRVGDPRAKEVTVLGVCIVQLHNGAEFWVKGSPDDVASLMGTVSHA